MPNATRPLSKPPRNSAESGRFGRFLESPLFWTLFIVVAFGIPLGRSLFMPKVTLPPVLGELGQFELKNQDGKSVQSSDLRGSVVVANFIFTSCPDICPLLTQQMARLQSRLMGVGPAVRLLSISVDPVNDTPEKLKAYGEKYHADFKTWQFLTGPLEKVRHAVVEGFKVAMDQQKSAEPANETAALLQITHGENFVIADQLGHIREYTTARNTEELNRIVRTIAILANSRPDQAPTAPSINPVTGVEEVPARGR